MFHARWITFPRSTFWRCLGMSGWSLEFFRPLHGSVLLCWTQHPCGLAQLSLALAARRGSKLNIFSSAGLQWEPVGKWRSLQQRPAFSHTAVFIILTSTCNDTLSPSLCLTLTVSFLLSSLYLCFSVSVLPRFHNLQLPKCQNLHEEKWRRLSNFSFSISKNMVLCVQVGITRQSKVDSRPQVQGVLSNQNHIPLHKLKEIWPGKQKVSPPGCWWIQSYHCRELSHTFTCRLSCILPFFQPPDLKFFSTACHKHMIK